MISSIKLLKTIRLFGHSLRSVSRTARHPNRMANIKPQNCDFFLVLDFEATCNEPKQMDPMEIIEFPVIKVNAQNFTAEQTFHRYVRPKVHTNLTPFCTKLTGIMDHMVANEPTFDVVFADFQQWLHSVGLICDDLHRPLKKFTFVTCGEWDLQLMLPSQCQLLNLRIPLYLRTWVNIKKSYANHYKQWPKSLSYMLDELKIKPLGRLHSGIDDCQNIVAIMKTMANEGVVFKNTSSEW
ncbi:ERI1 exoribonuclease 3-like [Oppia nitens]|uniref:ERI1 exoribonuclease 3-like n=1 Tax=Oppia nitens TaxID=1686743 RepID=UPI0023DAF616|nr:ERI1 exoribonuclease 3-like [Oppia nitens]